MSNSLIKNPFMACTASFICGIYAAGFFRLHFLPVYVPCFACLTGCFIFRRKNALFALFILAVFFLLGSSVLACARFLPAHHIQRFSHAFGSGVPVILKGCVISTPVPKGNAQRFRIRAESIEDRGSFLPCSGTLFVTARGGEAVFPGEGMLLKGRLRRPFAPVRAGAGKLPSVTREGAAGIMYDAVLLKNGLQKRSFPVSFYRKVVLLRAKLRELLQRKTSIVCAGILNAMVLGERSRLPETISNMMIRTGTVHILVVSGFNVGLVCFLCMLVLKVLRVPHVLRTLACCALVVGYCFITGSSSPVVRATLMALVFLCGRLLKRDADIGSSCALAALVMLAADPEELFDVGFQLSFASVFAIIWLYPRLKAFIAPRFFKPACLKVTIELFLVSLSAWLGSAGLIAWHFGFFTPVAVVANLFVVPLASLITLCGFSLIITESFFPRAAWVFAPASELLVHLLLTVNDFFIRLPGAYIRL